MNTTKMDHRAWLRLASLIICMLAFAGISQAQTETKRKVVKRELAVTPDNNNTGIDNEPRSNQNQLESIVVNPENLGLKSPVMRKVKTQPEPIVDSGIKTSNDKKEN